VTAPVTRDQLEAGMARARARAGSSDPKAGIHGPGSVTWELNREAVNFVGGGRAILLQLAHPYIAHAVAQHSTTLTDARGRFERTFAGVFAMAFGDLDQAFRAARRVYAIHSHVRGTIDEDIGCYRRGDPYQALDPRALFWVHATLVDSVLSVREHVFGPLDAYRTEAYYQESKRFAWLFGIPDELIPADHAAFRTYFQDMVESDRLAVGRPAREIGTYVLASPLRAFRPAMEWYRVLTAGMLPDPVRRAYGFRFGRMDRALFAASLRALRPAIRALPRQLRYLPAYLEAEDRLGLGAQRRLGRIADRLAITGMGIWPRPG
jgi:uncharacterized protein (DUF2236 family)